MDVVAAASIAAVAIAVVSKCFNSKSSDEEMGRQRGMSFSSSTLVEGSFPESTNVAPPIINSTIFFNNCPTESALMEVFENLIIYPRFASVATNRGGKWCFVATDVVLKDHVKTLELNSEEEIMREIDAKCAEDLNPNKPLWIFHRFVNKGSGVSCLLVRIHHVIGDGISLVCVMQKLFKTAQGEPLSMTFPDRPPRAPESTPNIMWKFTKSIFEVLSLAMSKYDSDTAFTSQDKVNMCMTRERHRTIWMPTLKLDFVKELKNKAAVTVNDVMMSAVAGALRRYCKDRHDPLFVGAAGSTENDRLLSRKRVPVQTRALLPVAFPRPKERLLDPNTALQNNWAFVSAPMPLDVGTSAKDRLSACCATTVELKTSPNALVQLWIQNNVLSVLPQFFVRKTAHDVFSRHSLVFSNVPGPPEQVSFAGETIVGLQAIFPNVLPQVLILSYGGEVFFNINVNVDQFPDAHKLPDLFLEEVTELAQSYGVDVSPAHMLAARSAEGHFAVIST